MVAVEGKRFMPQEPEFHRRIVPSRFVPVFATRTRPVELTADGVSDADEEVMSVLDATSELEDGMSVVLAEADSVMEER